MPWSKAQKYSGAPMRQSPSGWCEKVPSSGVAIIGASTAIKLFSELTAPMASPC